MPDSQGSCRIMICYNMVTDLGFGVGRVFFVCPKLTIAEIVEGLAHLSMADVINYEERCSQSYRENNPSRVLSSLYIADWKFLVPDNCAGANG